MHIPEYGKIKGTSVCFSSNYSKKCFTVLLGWWHRSKRKLLTFAWQLVIQSEPVNQNLISSLGRLHVPIHSMVPSFQIFKQLIKIPKCDYLRFIKLAGKLAKFAILLQDAHEGGSAALVSGQS